MPSKITLGKSHELPVRGKNTEKSWEIPYGWIFFSLGTSSMNCFFPIAMVDYPTTKPSGFVKKWGGAKSTILRHILGHISHDVHKIFPFWMVKPG